MRFKLSDKRLSELCLLISIPKIIERFPDYTPAERTIYRRLERYGITQPRTARKNYRQKLLLQAPAHLTDWQAKTLVDQKIRELIEEICSSIEDAAKQFESRFAEWASISGSQLILKPRTFFASFMWTAKKLPKTFLHICALLVVVLQLLKRFSRR